MYIFLTDSRIYHPQPNQIYIIKNRKISNKKIKIEFNLLPNQDMKDIIYIDVADFSFQTTNRSQIQKLRNVGGKTFIYPGTLPISLIGAFPNRMLFLPKNKDSLKSLSTLKITINRNNVCFELSNLKYISFNIPPLKIHNWTLADEFQKTIPSSIKMVRFNYPVFIDDKRPNHRFLNNLFTNFIKYNDQTRLNKQYKISQGRCMARAHSLSVLLNQYGITNYKIFKTWKNYMWVYHTAVMIIDAENNKWVMDPWVGRPKSLLTINQWLTQENEPTPITCSVTNSTTISPFYRGRDEEVMGEFLTQTHINDPGFFKALRAVYHLMIPNKPAKPFGEYTKRYSFFLSTMPKLSEKQGINNDAKEPNLCKTNAFS